jgi:hypothetical protein
VISKAVEVAVPVTIDLSSSISAAIVVSVFHVCHWWAYHILDLSCP